MLAQMSLYDVLRLLVQKVSWSSTEMMQNALQAVDAAEHAGALSRVAESVVCQHSEVNEQTGKCVDCNKQINSPKPIYPRYGRY